MSIEKMQSNDKKSDTFGERLRFFRKAKSLNSNDFAKLLDISQGSLSGLENNKVNTSSETLSNLAKNTNININWLLTGIGNPYKTPHQGENVAPGPSWELGEPNLPYGSDVGATGQFPEKIVSRSPLRETTQIGPAVDLLANILNSGDQVIVQALMANLHAFNRAVEKDRVQLGRIQELEEKCKSLEERVNAIESKQALDEKSKAA